MASAAAAEVDHRKRASAEMRRQHARDFSVERVVHHVVEFEHAVVDGLVEAVARLHAALAPQGVLGVWSASSDAKFVERLRRARLRVEEHRVAASGRRGKRHVVWIARR